MVRYFQTTIRFGAIAAGLALQTWSLALAEGASAPSDADASPGLKTAREKVLRLESMARANQARIELLQARFEENEASLARADRVKETREIVDEILAEGDFRETHSPPVLQAGYDKGFYIKSTDEAFLLKISGYVRARWTGQNRQTDDRRTQGRQKQDDINGFEIEDLRLIFRGYIHSPRLSYQIVGSSDTDAVNGWTTHSAWMSYKFSDEMSLAAGLGKVSFGRQELVSKTALQFVDRSVANELFNLERSIGVVLHGTLAKRLSYAMVVSNGIDNPNDSPSLDQLDTNFAYTARLVAHILGSSIKSESDLTHSQDPRLEMGISFAYNDDNGDDDPSAFYSVPERIRRGRGIGGNANADLTGTDLLQFGADMAFRYRGSSLTAEYWLRAVDGDSELSTWEESTRRDHSTHQQGGYIQAGYFVLPKRVEVAARLAGVWDNSGDNVWEYTVGVNYFPWESHHVVLQADFTHMAEVPSSSSSANWSQNDEISMVRVQMLVRF